MAQSGNYIPHRVVFNTASSEDFFRHTLNFICLMLPPERRLTDNEMDIMVYILAKPDGMGDGGIHQNHFSGIARRRLQAAMGMKTQTLSHYIKELCRKKWATRIFDENGRRDYHFNDTVLQLRKLYHTGSYEGIHLNIIINNPADVH